jgi:hypothetical protein
LTSNSRQAERHAAGEHRISRPGGGEDQPLHPPRDQPVNQVQHGVVTLCMGDEHGVALLRHRGLHPGEDRGEHRVGEIRHEDAGQPGLAGAQRGGEQVAPVAETRRSLGDARNNVRRDEVGSLGIERA